jgi:hypothetical protein
MSDLQGLHVFCLVLFLPLVESTRITSMSNSMKEQPECLPVMA